MLGVEVVGEVGIEVWVVVMLGVAVVVIVVVRDVVMVRGGVIDFLKIGISVC